MVVEGDSVAQEFIPRLIRLHQEGRFPIEELVGSYSSEDINIAFAESASGPR